jgi:hypothetical protein
MESDVRDRVRELEQFYTDIVRCRVAIEVPHRHRRDGRHFHVRVEITVPGGAPIVISHEPSLHAQLKDVEEDAPRKEARLTTYADTRAWLSTKHSLRHAGGWRTSRANSAGP